MLKRSMYLLLALLAAAPLAVVLATGSRPATDIAPEPLAPWETAPPGRYVVRVVGREFRWHFQVERDGFPVPQPDAGVLTLPTDSRIDWRVTSDDYIYALRIPELSLNLMAVPDLEAVATTTVDDPLERDLLVDPMCGFRLYHDALMGRVVFRPSRNTNQ